MPALSHTRNGSHSHPAHSVQLYGADERLLTVNVGNYIAEGLERGESVVVIAAPGHTSAFVRQLQLLDTEPDRAIEERRLMLLDAEKTLGTFMVDGQPDQTLFRKAMRSAIRGLRDAPGDAARRAYGEMVSVLWQRGEISAAIRLEEIWNEFLPSAGLQLFCAYSIDVFSADFQSPAVEKLLRAHTHVVPMDQDGDLDRALEWAIGDFAPDDSLKHEPDMPPAFAGVDIPKAERGILKLRAALPAQAPEILIRARRYYQTEKRFRALIENSSDAIVLLDLQGKILYASPSTTRVWKYAPDQMTGSIWLDLVHPDDREPAIRTLADALAAPSQAFRFEARVRRSTGDWGWVESTVMDLCDEPAVGGIVWNYRDITARKAAEQALRESERRLAARERYLQALLDSMPECVNVLGRNGEILDMNAAGVRMLEAHSADQLIGKCVYRLIDESDRAAFQSLNESVFDGGPGGSLEFPIVGLKGAHRTLETHVGALRDESERVIGALSVSRDVTERKAAEAALRRANEGLEQFAYAAAHDLQEPIRNVALYTELLARRYRDKLDEQANDFMDVTIEGARRMQALVEDLLAYTRSLDKSEGEQPQTNANQVVAEVLANLRTAIGATGAEVVCGDLPSLPVYRAHLVQLLQNLVGNALKYKSEEPPLIAVSAVELPDEFQVTVRDNGIGIPADQRERIFGVFKRLHGRNVAGNGIGLAICHRIISHYEGRIWVESQPGKGSAFVFTLPRQHPPAAQ